MSYSIYLWQLNWNEKLNTPEPEYTCANAFIHRPSENSQSTVFLQYFFFFGLSFSVVLCWQILVSCWVFTFYIYLCVIISIKIITILLNCENQWFYWKFKTKCYSIRLKIDTVNWSFTLNQNSQCYINIDRHVVRVIRLKGLQQIYNFGNMNKCLNNLVRIWQLKQHFVMFCRLRKLLYFTSN